MLTRKGLMKVKARAMRQRVWFKALSRAERAIIDLTIKCVEKVRSRILSTIVSSIVGKVLEILKTGFLDTVNRVGKVIAEELCKIALVWRNVSASSWKHDSSFIRVLGINAVNSTSFNFCGGHMF